MRSRKRGVAIEQLRTRRSRCIEAQLSLPHLQQDRRDRQRRVVAVVHGHLHLRALLKIRPQHRRNAQPLLPNLVSLLSKMHAQDGAARHLRCRLTCMRRNVYLAAEVAVIGRIKDKRHPLDRQPRRQQTVGNRLMALLLDVAECDRRSKDRLGFAARRHSRTPHHLWRCHECPTLRHRHRSNRNVQKTEARLLQMQRRVVREMLRTQIEERELTQTGRSASRRIHAGNHCCRQIIFTRQIQHHVGIRAGWHRKVKDNRAALRTRIEHLRAITIRLLRLAQSNRVWNLAAILVQAQILQRRRSVREYCWVDHRAGLSLPRRCKYAAVIAEVLLRRRRGHRSLSLQQQNKQKQKGKIHGRFSACALPFRVRSCTLLRPRLSICSGWCSSSAMAFTLMPEPP